MIDGKLEVVSKPQNRPRIKLIDGFGVEHHLDAISGKTLLDIFVDNSVEIAHSCGGMGSCGTCRIRLHGEKGRIPEREEVESEMAIERGFAEHERLSCQVSVPEGDVQWTAEALGKVDEV